MALQTILLKGEAIRKEYAAAAGITPGMLVELTSSGTVQAHGTDAGNASPMFALENDIAGKDIADAYVTSEVVQCAYCQRGAEVYAWLSAGENVAINDLLDSAGDGRLDAHVAPTENTGGVMTPSTLAMVGPVCRALEALDLSGTGAVATRIKVEVL